jgi:hypothetical protein
MSWTICLPVPKDATTIDGSRRICFTISTPYVPRLDPRPPEPRPPFVIHPNINPEDARHLQVLATIDQFAEELPSELSRDIQRSVSAKG